MNFSLNYSSVIANIGFEIMQFKGFYLLQRLLLCYNFLYAFKTMTKTELVSAMFVLFFVCIMNSRLERHCFQLLLLIAYFTLSASNQTYILH